MYWWLFREDREGIEKFFLKSKHNIWVIQFWPDMTSIHYDKDVKGWLESHGIQYVKKSDNTQNCPQIRPIEKIWAFIKRNTHWCLKFVNRPEIYVKSGLKLVKISAETREMLLWERFAKNCSWSERKDYLIHLNDDFCLWYNDYFILNTTFVLVSNIKSYLILKIGDLYDLHGKVMKI